MESEMELEQDCQRDERAVVEICEPENVIVEDVEFETSIDSIKFNSSCKFNNDLEKKQIVIQHHC